MIKLTLKHTNGVEKTLLVPREKPLKDILEEDEYYSSCDDVLLNGHKLSDDDLAKAICDLGDTNAQEITLMIEPGLPWVTDDDPADNDPAEPDSACLPQVVIVGCACVIFSSFSPDELRDFSQYLPEALTLRDENGKPVFAITLDEKSSGSLTKYGAVFSGKTNAEGRAAITILIDPECEDTGAAVRGALGSAIISLAGMEEHLMSRKPELQEKKRLLNDHITAL